MGGQGRPKIPFTRAAPRDRGRLRITERILFRVRIDDVPSSEGLEGSSKTSALTIGVLLRSVFDERWMSLTILVRTNSAHGWGVKRSNGSTAFHWLKIAYFPVSRDAFTQRTNGIPGLTFDRDRSQSHFRDCEGLAPVRWPSGEVRRSDPCRHHRWQPEFGPLTTPLVQRQLQHRVLAVDHERRDLVVSQGGLHLVLL